MTRGVATHQSVPGANTITNPALNSVRYKRIEKAPDDTAISAIVFAAHGWYQNFFGEQNQLYSYQMSVDVEYPAGSGTLYSVTWNNGAATVTVSPGTTIVQSDPLPGLTIPAGAEYYIRVWALFDFSPPAATLTITGGQFASTNITDAGHNLNLAIGSSENIAMTAGVTGVGAGTGGSITAVVTAGALTGLTLAAGSGYTDGVYAITFDTGVHVGVCSFPTIVGEIQQWGTDIVNSAGSAVDPTFTNISASWSPPMILAAQSSVKPSIGILGDSLVFGQHDTTDATGRTGFAQKALYGPHGVFDIARGGNGAFAYVARASAQSLMLANITHLLCVYGRNDVELNASSLAQLQADLRSVWAPFIAANIPIFQCTIVPTSTSSDSWTTTVNQTTSVRDATRQSANAWLRASFLTEGLTALVDIAAIVEDGGTSAPTGKWNADGATPNLWTNDGVHPSPFATTQILDSGILVATAGGIGRRKRMTWT